MAEIFARGPLRFGTGAVGTLDRDSVDLRIIARRFWKDRWVFLMTVITCGLLAAVLVSRVTPQFTSVSQLLLDSRAPQPTSLEALMSNRVLNDAVMGSEISILQSNTLLESVIEQIDAAEPGALDALDGSSASPGLVTRALGGLRDMIGPEGMESPESEELARMARIERLTWAIRRVLDVWRVGDSYVITISVETPDPGLSMLIAQSIAERYVSLQLETQRAASAQAAEWIAQRVADLRVQVSDAETAVEDYRARSIEETGTSLEIISQRLVSLNDELIEARAALVGEESRLNEIERLIADEGVDSIGNLLTSAPILELNSQRLDLLAEDAQWAESFGPDHPERQKIRIQLDEIERAVAAETRLAVDAQRKEVQIARIREQTMNESLEEAEQQFLQISRSSNGLRQLEREADVVRNLYIELLNQYTETQTKEQLQQSDARIIERATFPGAPSAPRPKLMTALGLLVGAALGVGLVAFRQISRGTFATLSELEHEIDLPVLSALPERKWATLRDAVYEVDVDRLGAAAESIRRLRNELSIGKVEAEPQSIALLSALQDEGKTTTTVLVGTLSEKADNLVVVVDCDFRHNSIQREFDFVMDHDFADYLRGECTALEALQTTTGLGFDLLALREPDPNIADAITATNLRELIEELKNYYDTVLVNCPAILPAAESLIIAGAVDKRALLVRHDSTPRAATRRALAALQNKGLSVTGQVMTRIDTAALQDSSLYTYSG